MGPMASWLGLHGNFLPASHGYITHNAELGWMYSQGSLMGVSIGDKLSLNLPAGQSCSGAVAETFVDSATLVLKTPNSVALDPSKQYEVNGWFHKRRPTFAVNNLDGDPDTGAMLRNILQHEQAQMSEQITDCDFTLVIFNELAYFTFPEQPFQPLHRQFDLLDESHDDGTDTLSGNMRAAIQSIEKWFHFRSLENDEYFSRVPVKVEIQLDDGAWQDITLNSIELRPEGDRRNGALHKDYRMRLSNVTDEKLLVTALLLFDARLEISDDLLDHQSKMVEAGRSIEVAYRIMLDHFQEVYNWPRESVVMKLIVTRETDLTAVLPDFTHGGLPEPLTGFRWKGGMKPPQMAEGEPWGIYTSTISLLNTTVNRISGHLQNNFDWYCNHELIGPFMINLYSSLRPGSLNHDRIFRPTDRAQQERSLKVFIGNTIDYSRRIRAFRRLKRKFSNKSIIVAEGDSWFLYPILVKDTIDYLRQQWPVYSLAWAGDTLENYKKSGQLLKKVDQLHPKYVLISGGGNDIIGPEIQKILGPVDEKLPSPERYLNGNYSEQMEKIVDLYTYFFDELTKRNAVEKILVHGYDYVRSDHATMVNKGGWVNKYMIKAGIHDVDERKKLIDYLIDGFNEELKTLSDQYPKVIFLDIRGTVARDEWYDEIHPNDRGYKKVADRFLAQLA